MGLQLVMSVLRTGMLLILLASSSLASASKSILTRKSKLMVEKRNQDVLISPDGTFSCGFYQVGDNAFTFSIWFSPWNATNSIDPSPYSRADVVWSANRDRPVNGRRSTVSLQGRSFLVLTDGYDDSAVWTTTVTSSSNNEQVPSNKPAAAERAELLDTGNLVLRDAKGNIMWQSFDFPTDTILSGQPFTRDTRLTASASTNSLSTGFYVFYFDNDNVLRLMYDGPDITSIYWPNPEKMIWDNGRTTYNSSRYAILDRAGQFISTDDLKFVASDHSAPVHAVRRRLTLDPDGNLRLYSYRNNSENRKNRWYVSWQAMPHKGKIHGTCGRNGICTYRLGLEPSCSCPPGYRRANPTNWKDGCYPDFIIANADSQSKHYFCPSKSNGSYQFLEVPHTDFYGSDTNFTRSLSFNTCRSICEQDCHCQGFVYRQTGEGNCYPKFALFNGYSSPEFISTLFLKLPRNYSVSRPNITFTINPNLTSANNSLFCPVQAVTTPMTTNTTISITTSMRGSNIVYGFGGAGGSRSSASRFKWAYGYAFVAVFGFIEFLFIAIGWWFLYLRGESRNSTVYSLEIASKGSRHRYKHAAPDHFRMFSYHELKRATNNFKHLLGKGGSGEVYKGVLDDKRVVAVKRLPNAEKGTQGDEEFRAELSVIGRIYHMNLVRMWGFCVQASRRILIYEYVENGSLDKALFLHRSEYSVDINSSTGSNLDSDTTYPSISSASPLLQENPLNWPKRYGIALGLARGLAYLHHECLDWVIHCDIKPENILLDADYHPKIADFGLVKLTQRDSPGSQLSRIRGTNGYMAPEWTSNTPITAKVDVYSYGVILLELLRGARLSTWNVSSNLASDHNAARKHPELRVLVQVLKQGLASDPGEHPEEKEEQLLSLPTIIEEFMDPRLHGDFNRMQARVLLEVALSCLEEDRYQRPTMDCVVQLLINSCEFESGYGEFDQ